MKKGLIFWFTGLSGAGKSTVASGVKSVLEKDGFKVLILDGDDIRNRLHVNLGFSEQDIKKNNFLIAHLCQDCRYDYDVILVSIISPYEDSRKKAREMINDGFYEIYFSADLETVMNRDVKKLYSKAKRNEISNLIGYSPGTVYEVPVKPDYIVNCGKESVQESVEKFYQFILKESRS